MKNSKLTTNKKQRGFALIEVMLAALVMTVGGVAYMKLQQRGLQYGFNNYARTQGIAITQDFVEQLRSNVGYVSSAGVISGSVSPTASPPADITACNSSASASSASGASVSTGVNGACAERVFGFQNYLIAQQMKAVTERSILCYQESAAVSGLMRVTYLWQDNSKEGKNVVLNCPADFNTDVNQNNSVTIYAQL